MAVCVLGSDGFIGRHVVRALRSRGAETISMKAPRLSVPWGASNTWTESDTVAALLTTMARQMSACTAVVNCAGAATPGASQSAELYGANAMLPLIVDMSRLRASVPRFVHISSIAVQGDREVLDESPLLMPYTPYGRSKAAGEQLLLSGVSAGLVVFRAGSVHSSDRTTTAQLAAFARSRLSSVAGSGDWPSPQTLVVNLGAAIAHLATCSQAPPSIVLQPAEGQTAASVLRTLGLGREPHHVSEPWARKIISGLAHLPSRGRLAATRRRLKLLWYGQAQASSWLEREGFVLPSGPEGWADLAASFTTADGRGSNVVSGRSNGQS